MKLSANLSLAEMIRSDSAKRLGINNQPTQEHLENMKILATKIFEPIREHFGVPIYISSGYRSEALNKAIKGSKTSQHCVGQAMDIDMDGSGLISNAEIFMFIRSSLQFDQLIWEFGDTNNPDWVHVSYASHNRGQVLKAIKKGKTTKYIPY